MHDITNDLERQRQTLRSMIARYQREADGLIARYGYGVRPSFVSADLADAYDRVARYKAELAELDALEDDGFTTIVPEVK